MDGAKSLPSFDVKAGIVKAKIIFYEQYTKMYMMKGKNGLRKTILPQNLN